ncbi:transposable element Tcb2 transposase [Trichonephila clavipes]|nr:transposable element Tcb2 transposase [Trichonephila clavipes]
MLRSCKTVALGHRMKGVQPNSTYRLHEGGLYARRPIVCIPLTPRHRVARRRWAAEHRVVIGAKCCLQKSRFSLGVTPDVFLYGGTGALNPAFVREMVGWYGVKNHSEWYFDGPKHVSDILGRRIAARPRPPATVRDLEIALLEEWNSIPQSLIDNLIASMENRCAAVLAVRGDHALLKLIHHA